MEGDRIFPHEDVGDAIPMVAGLEQEERKASRSLSLPFTLAGQESSPPTPTPGCPEAGPSPVHSQAQIHLQRKHNPGKFGHQTGVPAAQGFGWWTAAIVVTGPESGRWSHELKRIPFLHCKPDLFLCQFLPDPLTTPLPN